MQLRSYIEGLDKISRLKHERRYTEALCEIEKLSDLYPYASEILLIRALLQQVSEGDHSLLRIENDLRAAQNLSPTHLTTKLELAHFLYAVADRPLEALELFQSARALALASLKDAFIGEIRCHIDKKAWNHIHELASEAERLFPGDLDLELLRDEIAEFGGK